MGALSAGGHCLKGRCVVVANCQAIHKLEGFHTSWHPDDGHGVPWGVEICESGEITLMELITIFHNTGPMRLCLALKPVNADKDQFCRVCAAEIRDYLKELGYRLFDEPSVQKTVTIV